MIRWVVLDTTSYYLVGYIYSQTDRWIFTRWHIYWTLFIGWSIVLSFVAHYIIRRGIPHIGIDALSWLWSSSNGMLGCFYATPLVLMLCHDFDFRGERGMGLVRDDVSWEGGGSGDEEWGWSCGYHYYSFSQPVGDTNRRWKWGWLLLLDGEKEKAVIVYSPPSSQFGPFTPPCCSPCTDSTSLHMKDGGCHLEGHHAFTRRSQRSQVLQIAKIKGQPIPIK
jgi:hypothetical protein